MELILPYSSSYLAALLATLALILITLRLRRPKLNLPPGPKSWPIIGNLHLLGPLPHRSIHDMSKKHGPIMQLKFGSFPVVVGSSTEMAKAFLKTHDAVFAERPKTALGKYLSFNYSDFSFLPYGPLVCEARKICSMTLFNAKSIDSFEYIRVEEMKLLRKHLYESSGRPILLKEYLSDLSHTVISRMVIGEKYTDESVTLPELKEMIDESFSFGVVSDIGDFIPWLRFLDLQGNIKKMKALAKRFDRFLEKVVDEHKARRKGVQNYVAKYMVDVLVESAGDPTLDVKFERHHIKAFIMNLLSGGTETVTSVVEWGISALLRNPEILNKATEELDRVIGRDRWVGEKDIVNLPLIDAIIKETMRLHPVGPLLMPRIAREDCKVAGYDIPKGTGVLICTWTIGRDPALWENPTDFYPDRFLEKSVDVKGNDFTLLPFGAGRRMCPGYNQGLKMVQISFANLLHGFSWNLPGNMSKEELSMEESFGVTTIRKYPLEVIPQPRLSPHLYNFLLRFQK